MKNEIKLFEEKKVRTAWSDDEEDGVEHRGTDAGEAGGRVAGRIRKH